MPGKGKCYCHISPRGYLSMCLLVLLRGLPDFLVCIIQLNATFTEKLPHTRSCQVPVILRWLSYGDKLCPRGAQAHVTSLFQTLKWHSEMSLGHTSCHDSPRRHQLPAVLWTWQAHSPAVLHLLLPASNALPTSLGLSSKSRSQGTFSGSLLKIQFPTCHCIFPSACITS